MALATVLALTALTATTATAAPAPTVLDDQITLDHGHIDAFNLVLDADDSVRITLKEDVTGSHVLREPETVELFVKDSALTSIPDGFVPGLSGNVYYLPLTQDHTLIWPGWDTQSIASVFPGADTDIVVREIDGPGEVFLWSQGSFGAVTSLLKSGGHKLPDTIAQPYPAHTHANWAFTKPGTYKFTVQANVTDNTGKTGTTRTAIYTFVVAERTELVPPAPTQQGNTVTVPAAKWVEYRTSSGQVLAPGAHSISADTTITAQAALGFTMSPETITAWTFAHVPDQVFTSVDVAVLGDAEVGSTLSAQATAAPAADGFSYQWLVDGKTISGATGSSYTVTAGDAGKKVSVAVTASKTGFASVTKTSAAKTVTVPVTPVKDFTSVTVTISGDAKAGSTLTAKATTTPQADTFSYQWLVDGKAVAGATKSTYTVTAGDAGKKISVTVTASKSGYTATSATSTQVSVAKAANKAFTKSSVKVTGKAQVAKTLTAKTTFSPKADKVSYQWLRNGKSIKGATKSTYKVAAADAGKKLSVKATASKSGYAKKTATSKATAKVAKAKFAKVTTKVTGAAKAGKTLKVKVTVKPKASKISYQWQSNGKSIKGATKSSYKVKKADAGKKISVKVTVKKSGYSNKSVTSKRTATVAR
jgi:surface-anchored protein